MVHILAKSAKMLLTLSLVLLAGSSAACSKFKLPQMFFGEDPLPQTPITVTLEFTEDLRQAMITAEACDQPWEMSLGHAVTEAFVEAGQESFAGVRLASDPAASDGTASQMTVRVGLIGKSFDAVTKMGAEDRYLANVTLELMATYFDVQGNQLASMPLTYNNRFNVWTPSLGSGGTECTTGQLDAAVDEGAQTLARQMVVTAHTLVDESPQLATAPATQAGQARRARPTRQPREAPPLSVRSTLLDANDNVILEGGEKIGVRIEATNTGNALIPSATVTLAGTPTLIDAFARTSASKTIGPLEPGETQRTELWGEVPPDVSSGRGELSVSVTASSEDQAGHISHSLPITQTLVAAIRPGAPDPQESQTAEPAPSPSETSPKPPKARNAVPASSPSPSPAPSTHLAVLIGLEQYREAWPELHPVSARLEDLTRTLTGQAGLADHQILVLKDQQATRSDFEQTVFHWLPERATEESILLVYFAGQAVTDPRLGEVFLLPYEGSPASSHVRLISLRSLQKALLNVPAKARILVIHAPTGVLERSPFRRKDHADSRGPTQAHAPPPNWHAALPTSKGTGSAPGQADASTAGQEPSSSLIQIVFSGGHTQDATSLLNGLQGDADVDLNGKMTVREILHHLQGKALIVPDLPADALEADLELFQIQR